jgi:hypothetical protein
MDAWAIVYMFDLTGQMIDVDLREEHPHRWLDRLRLREYHSTQRHMDRRRARLPGQRFTPLLWVHPRDLGGRVLPLPDQ